MNGQHSTWVNNEAGVLQGSILGPMFFLIYINDLLDDLTSNPKSFADDTFLLSIAQNINSTTINLISDLSKISDWVFQWKINFHPDPNKQAQEVIFSRKVNKINHSPLLFNQNLLKSSSAQKHLEMVLDTKLDFNLHLKNVQRKVNKTIRLIRKLPNILPRESLVIIYRSFLRPHLDDSGITLSEYRFSSIQCSISKYGFNKKNFKRKNLSRIRLGFESLQQRR